jgi:hypothetical protein
MNRARQTTTLVEQGRTNALTWVSWLPLIALLALAFIYGQTMPAWGFMCAIAFAMYTGGKWLTYWQNRNVKTTIGRRVGYLLLWPGMDAKAFLTVAKTVTRPPRNEWAITIVKIGLAIVLVWGVARRIPEPLLRGWCGLAALVVLVHFGVFHLCALIWQSAGVDARPLMNSPIKSTSLSEFWGLRWNSAFNRLVYDELFRPLYPLMGTPRATMMVFLASGLIHELVISVPARGGYGLPTIYFLIQGAGLMFERTVAARKFGLRRGIKGWLFTVAITVGPAFWLFNPTFITRVILPFLHVLNAT